MRLMNSRLDAAVMTSSSERALQELFSEIKKISGVNCFDLMIPRRADLNQIKITSEDLKKVDVDKMSKLIVRDEFFQPLRNFLLETVRDSDVRIAALATYFPDVTSEAAEHRNTAIRAIAKTMQLAGDLCCQRRPYGMPCMTSPIVEIVCGTIIDPPPDKNPGCAVRHVWSVDHKLDQLCVSLTEAINLIKDDPEYKGNDSFALALELEPGETYVLNGEISLEKLIKRLTGEVPVENADPELLNRHVGLNLDIAHMRIARVRPEVIKKELGRVVHGHISDHPRMHTHDQFVGSWTSPHLVKGGYQPYIRLLYERASQFHGDGLPFSNALAVELEGCNRVFSIHDSLNRLSHVTSMAANRQ